MKFNRAIMALKREALYNIQRIKEIEMLSRKYRTIRKDEEKRYRAELKEIQFEIRELVN